MMAERGGSATRSKAKAKTPLLRACDACRYRRVKCDGRQPCIACSKNGIDCLYLQPPKKKGPTAKRINKIREEQQGRATTSDPPDPAFMNPPSTASYIQNTQQFENPREDLDQNIAQDTALSSITTSDGFANQTLPSDLFLVPPSYQFIPDTTILDALTLSFGNDTSTFSPFTDTSQNLTPDGSSWFPGCADPGLTNDALVQSGLSLHSDFDSVLPPTLQSIKSVISLFYDRLHPTIPVFAKDWLLARIDRGEQAYNPQLRAMLLAMNALVLIQPIKSHEGEESAQQLRRAESLIDLTLQTMGSTYLGEDVNLDAVMTSFYLFACFFGLQKHGAAWFRLREAVTLGQLLRLDDSAAYRGLEADERERRLRAYRILAITERAYALQRNHPINFRGQPGRFLESLPQGVVCHDPEDSFLQNHLNLFDIFDEAVVDCWNGQCAGKTCTSLTADKAIGLQRSLGNTTTTQAVKDWARLSEQEAIQYADLKVTQHWLRNRMWQLCLGHGLIGARPDTPRELSVDLAVDIAKDTLSICEKAATGIIEACGIGFVEKLYDIAQTLLRIIVLVPSMYVKGWDDDRMPPFKLLLNKFLAIMAVFRGGQHPYLQPLIQSLSSLSFEETFL